MTISHSPSPWAETPIDRWYAARACTYPLTLEHVRDYLTTKGDGEPVGMGNNSGECLLAQTLNWLYPQEAPWSVGYSCYGRAIELMHVLNPVSYPLDRELGILVSVFDDINGNPYYLGSRVITKARFKIHLEYVARVMPGRLLFTVAELFPEVSREYRSTLAYADWMTWQKHLYASEPVVHIDWTTAKETFTAPAPEFFSIETVLKEAQAQLETETETEKKEVLELVPA